MGKTATLNIRVNPDVKENAESVLAQLGIPMATVIDMYLKQISLVGGIPFSIVLPKAANSVNADMMSATQIHQKLEKGYADIEKGNVEDPEVRKEAAKRIRESGFTAIIVIGGDGSFTGALELSELGVPCICIPGTIDNDLGYTEKTLGYDTAVNVSVNAVRAIRATSRSHERPHVVQVMGRRSGDIALKTAMATGAEMLVVPECEWDIDQISKRMMNLIERGNNRSTLIIGEHCWHMMKPYDWRKVLKDAGDKVHDDDELDAPTLARVLKRLTGAEVRSTVVGYTQRGATPSSSDSAFAFETAKTAINLIRCGNTNLAIGQKHGMVYSLPIKEALNIHHVFNIDTYELINQL